MKVISTVLIFAMALGMGISAFAATKGDVNLAHEATLKGTKLPAGSYQVAVDGSGPDVKVTFLQNSKVIAIATGKLAESKVAPEFSAVVMDAKNGNAITEVRVAKLKGAVTINQ